MVAGQNTPCGAILIGSVRVVCRELGKRRVDGCDRDRASSDLRHGAGDVVELREYTKLKVRAPLNSASFLITAQRKELAATPRLCKGARVAHQVARCFAHTATAGQEGRVSRNQGRVGVVRGHEAESRLGPFLLAREAAAHAGHHALHVRQQHPDIQHRHSSHAPLHPIHFCVQAELE